MREVEVKAKLVNETAVLEQLTGLGCALSQPILQKDTIFIPNGQLELPVAHGVRVLRIREEQGKLLLTLKYSVTSNLDKVERELEINDAQQMRDIITDLGFYEVATVEKIRRKGKLAEKEVCIDEVTHLGAFIEVERLVPDEDVPGVQDELYTFLESLGVTDTDHVHDGYDVLMFKKQKHENE